ncbi:MAG: hypothetical protein KatS3mg017_0627 [Fimbriimonadales bacterium]|nr:MAG: hypothetical protein KatS3mg017_0627 [Fimbriimonadales bacterium]
MQAFAWSLGIVGLGVSFMLGGALVRLATPYHAQRAETLDALTVYDKKAMASVVGEFRGSVAGYLWAKTDEYTHGGVRMRPMTEREKLYGTAHAASSADGLHDHQHETSIIPEPERDPRWLWGAIERSVKPYFDVRHHFHRPVREVLPLYRFMAWIDPTFVPSYLVGAQMILFDNPKNLPQALAFLEEGARQNPKSIAIFTELGRYHLLYTKDYARSERYLLKALENGASWMPSNPFEREGLLHAYRWLALKAYKQGELGRMRTWAWRGLQRFPDDGALQMLMEKRR